MKVPVTIAGRVCGRAEISNGGDIINIELTPDALPGELRDMFLKGHADALSIDTHLRPEHPAPLTQEQKSQRWEQRNIPHGM